MASIDLRERFYSILGNHYGELYRNSTDIKIKMLNAAFDVVQEEELDAWNSLNDIYKNPLTVDDSQLVNIFKNLNIPYKYNSVFDNNDYTRLFLFWIDRIKRLSYVKQSDIILLLSITNICLDGSYTIYTTGTIILGNRLIVDYTGVPNKTPESLDVLNPDYPYNVKFNGTYSDSDLTKEFLKFIHEYLLNIKIGL